MIIQNQMPLDRMMTVIMQSQKEVLQAVLTKPGSMDKFEETLKIAAERESIIDVVA